MGKERLTYSASVCHMMHCIYVLCIVKHEVQIDKTCIHESGICFVRLEKSQPNESIIIKTLAVFHVLNYKQ